MLNLLDANILIDAENKYYPIDGVPEYWSWLHYQGKAGRVRIPREIFEEITPSKGTSLQIWMGKNEIKNPCYLMRLSIPIM